MWQKTLFTRFNPDVMDELFGYAMDDFNDQEIDEFEPPGDCTLRRHELLQRQVSRYCKRNRACVPEMRGCNNLSQRIKLNVQCSNARRTVNQECFRGGDAGHLRAQEDATRAANNCRRMWQQNSKCQTSRPRNIRRFDY